MLFSFLIGQNVFVVVGFFGVAFGFFSCCRRLQL